MPNERKVVSGAFNPYDLRLDVLNILVAHPQRIIYEDADIESDGKLQPNIQRRRLATRLGYQLVRAQEVFAGRDEAVMIISPTSYEAFLSAADERVWPSRGLRAPSPLSVGALTFTSDNYLVLGQRSQTVGTERGRLHLVPAGYMEWSEVIGSKRFREPHIHALRRELFEELGVRKYQELQVLGVANRETVDNPMIIFTLRLAHTRNRLLKYWEQRQSETSEHEALVFLQKREIEVFSIEQWQNLTEHLKCALLLYRQGHDRQFFIGGCSSSIAALTLGIAVHSAEGEVVWQDRYQGTKNVIIPSWVLQED